ncbi:hypothetical protein Tco_1556977 [Tanacetum coccineum]
MLMTPDRANIKEHHESRPLLLSFDFVFMSEIFKSLSFSLDRLCRLAILCLDQLAHTLHHLERLLTISLDNNFLDNLDILKEDLEYQIKHEQVGFAAALAVLTTGASQSRQHVLTVSVNIHISGICCKLSSCLHWLDGFHELVLAGDLLSIGIQNCVVDIRLKYSVVGVLSLWRIVRERRRLHAVAIASAQKNKGSLEAESIVRAASTRVRFHLSTTPFCSGVRGVEV